VETPAPSQALADSATPIRRTVLITHANPEDNLFARWLASRLMAAGYEVWVDVRSLKGGDDFWDVIETQLRRHAIKQIVLISQCSIRPGLAPRDLLATTE
jgi:hypothetical protein